MSRKKRAVVIGAGHNGLVCAWRLARAGMQVTVLERRGVVGGAAVTEEFAPGFRNSVASYTVSLLHDEVQHAMRLADHGLRIVERPIANFLPTEDGRYLKLGGGLSRSQQEIAKFSARDAERLPAYYERLETIARLLGDLSRLTPPRLQTLRHTLPEAIAAMRRARRLTLEQQRDLLALFTRSAREFLDPWFESAPIKALLGFDSIVGHFASPDHPGTSYVLLHHCFGGVNGKPGVWGHAIGGMGAITQAMAQACTAAGATIRVEAPAQRVLVRRGKVEGVELASGEAVSADIVAANVHPRLLFERLVPEGELTPAFRDRIGAYKSGSGSFRMNVALSELPDFSALPGTALQEHHASGIVIGPTLDYLDRAYDDARRDGTAAAPVVEMVISSALDDTLAPPGAHVASLFCQHVDPHRDWNGAWPQARERMAAQVIAAVTRFAPNFARSIVARTAMGPADLEEKFGLVGGDIFHGRMSLDQLWAARPILGNGDYRAPIRNLYLCGSGAHPGGGVSGLPGWNAAREILRDGRLL